MSCLRAAAVATAPASGSRGRDVRVASGTSRAPATGKPARAPGMRRSVTQERERKAVRRVAGIVEDDLDWLFREQPLPDYGVDVQAEVVAGDQLVTGRFLGLQIRGGNSRFARPRGKNGWTFRETSDHLDYWLRYSVPVLVIIVDSDGRAFWEVVTPTTVKETAKGFTMVIPRSQPFDVTARDKLLALAGRSQGLMESFPAFCALLPPNAVGPLRRAADSDPLPAARLAERLATGRNTPGMTAASVIAAAPTWLTGSPAAQDLWLAVAGYAAEHAQPRESGRAFALAADSAGPRAARARALAGLELIPVDRDAARDHLRRARDDGEAVFADVGLAVADIPPDDARPVDVPASLRGAPADRVNTEPFLLNFLAELAVRRCDFTEAVKLREQAVTASGDRDTAYRLTLAATLRRRTLSEPGSSSTDLRRALGHAQAAVEERRRWSGPSADALAEVLDILAVAGDMTAVVRAALPASEAGTALDAEVKNPGVARRGAHAALASRNRPAYEIIMQLLPDGPYRRELQALDDDDQGRPPEEKIAAWRRLLDDPADDAMTARCVASLARLGTWPPQADELRGRSVLPAEEYEALKAVCRARSGESGVGIARLRELADKSLLAAGELVQLLEEDAGPEVAITEAEQQITRWQAPPLRIQYVDLLGRHGRFGDAAAFIERTIPDDSLPADVRQKLCAWHVAQLARQGKFIEAAATARAGLAIGEDPGLAWRLIMVLVNDGKLHDARQALARYSPEPGTDQEIRLWMQLHLGVTVTAADARVMISLVRRQPDGDFRDAIIAMLIREVVLAEKTGSFPGDVIAAVARLEEETRDRPGTGLRIDPDDDDALRAALEKQQPGQAAYRKLLAAVQDGAASMADIARFGARRPYGSVLLHRPAGVLPAADLAPGLRAAGEQAARRAIAAGACVADLSSLHLLGLLGDDDRLRIRSALPRLIAARPAVDDALLTRDHARGTEAATYTASLAADGTIERTVLTAVQQALLRGQAETLERMTVSADVRYPPAPSDAVASTLALAAEHELALWCDDVHVVQKARAAGIAAFSLLDLITVLSTDGTAVDLPTMYRRLASQYVADLPLTADDITALAVGSQWLSGPAHTALARPGWWRHHDSDWTGTWLQIATQARGHSAQALTTIAKAALTGAIQHAGPSFRTQRYQQIVVLALLACHNAGQAPPDGLLGQLAEKAPPGLPPGPPYVLTALISELRNRAVPDAEHVARRLLPGTDLP